jgi:phosphatase NudJ
VARDPIPTWVFALVVVRRGDRFLLVQEAKHGNLWYLPAGRVEPGETLAAGAVRETLEEAGIPVALRGILRIEHTPRPDGTARMRVRFLAEPSGDAPPKTVADGESLRAGWFTLAEIRALPLRGDEVLRLFEDVARGAPVYPLSVLQPEGMPLLP